MAQLTPKIQDSVENDGLLEHTINVDATSERRARRKSMSLVQLKDFTDPEIVSVNSTGDGAPPGFTNYEVVVTALR